MVNLQSLWIIFSLCVVQLPNTNLTKIIITLLNMFSFLLPLWAVSKFYSFIYLFSFDRFLVTSVIFIVYSATIFAWLPNFKTSFLNMKIERLKLRRSVQERLWDILPQYHFTTLNRDNFNFFSNIYKVFYVCFLLCYFRLAFWQFDSSSCFFQNGIKLFALWTHHLCSE